jgi:hypothetical protein
VKAIIKYKWACDVTIAPSPHLTPIEQELYEWHRFVFEQTIFLLTAELMPLLFCMHWASTSDHAKLNEEQPHTRFHLPNIAPAVLKWFLRPLAVVPMYTRSMAADGPTLPVSCPFILNSCTLPAAINRPG